MVAVLHFVTGKGGVGKSTFAAALAHTLASQATGPVLLCDVLGNGVAANYLGHSQVTLDIHRCYDVKNLWVTRTEPQSAFREYIALLLSLGASDGALLNATSRIRGTITDLIVDNKVVRTFVKACPGLEPIVMLGKLCWEAKNGTAPEIEQSWGHIVVDAPASGHFIQLFQSTLALLQVFESGPIRTQAEKIVEVFKSQSYSKYYMLSLPEELPLKEALELDKQLKTLGLPHPKTIINRYPDSFAPQRPNSEFKLSKEWENYIEWEGSRWETQKLLLQDFELKLGRNFYKIHNKSPHSGKSWIIDMIKHFAESNGIELGQIK